MSTKSPTQEEESCMNKQFSFADFNQNFDELLHIQPLLLQLFEEFIDLRELIPCTWSLHYYKDTGHPHNNSLPAIVSALLLQKLLSIPSVELLITFLHFSEDLRNFCALRLVPDPSFFSASNRNTPMTLNLSSISWLILPNPFARNSAKPSPKN